MDKRPLTAEELLEHLYRGLNVEPDVQTEMDAQDLRELEQNDALETTQPIAAPSPAEPAAAESPAAADENSAAAMDARRAKTRLALGFTVVLTGAIVAGALYESPGGSGPLVNAERATAWLERATVDAEPVRFANPFDENEVFEFPAGTSEQDARDAVAGFLLQRAMARQANVQ
jgi:hypothetical protein